MSYEFNTDLLFNDADRNAASERFPDIYFALDNSELRGAFSPLDEEANLAKKRSRQWGTAAVILGLVALAAAGAQPLYEHQNATAVHWITGVTAAAGVISVAIGFFGVMFRARKTRWLQRRLATERLRQFHFQSIVAQIPEILHAADDESAKTAFLLRRKAELDGLKRDVLNLADAEMPGANAEDEAKSAWIWQESGAAIDAGHGSLEQLLAAYATLRFARQKQYADYRLKGIGRLWKNAPGRQAKVFSGLALACVLLIMIVHALIISGAAFGVSWMTSPMVHVAAIWIAVSALAARTLEEGLQPGREVERLREYQTAIKAAHQRFSSKTGSIEDKLAAMRQMEEASYEEMLLFLKAGQDAKFVM